MKKIITLLVSVTMVASAFAQFGGKDQRGNSYGKDVVYGDGRYKDNSFSKNAYFFSPKDRDMQISQINWNYDRQVQSVKNRFFMPRFKKDQMICQLEAQRKSEINMVMMKFNSHDNGYNGYSFGSKDGHDQRRNW
jgi:hypothetical protein